MNREQLNEKAREVGIEDPASFDTKADLTAAIQEAEEQAQGEQPNGVLVTRDDEGGYRLTPLGDVKATELPTVLRQAAKAADVALGIS